MNKTGKSRTLKLRGGQGGIIYAQFGIKGKHAPYFWVGTDTCIGFLDHRSEVKKLKRLCEDFLERTEK
jgi:hypothetical protein